MKKITIILILILGLLVLVPIVSAFQPQPPLSKFEVCDKGDCEEPDETFRDIACKNVTFRSTSEDPLGKKLTYEWQVNNEKKGTGETLNYTLPEQYAEETIRLIVTNEYGLNDTSSIRVISKNNLHHEIETLSVKRVQIEDDDFEEEHDIEKTIRFVTGTNNNVTITREFDEDSCDDQLKTNVIGDVIIVESTCTESECKTTLRFPEKGRCSVELIDSDLCGHSVSTLLDIEVIVNRLPTTEITGDTIAREGDDIILSGENSSDGGDKDDKIVEYCLKIVPWGENSADYDWDCSSSGRMSISEEYGEYNATIRVKDLYGGEATATTIIAFDRTHNRGPTSVMWAPEEVRPYQKFTANLWNSTDDKGIVTYVVEVICHDKVVQTINSSTPEFEISLNRTGICTLRGTVTDGADIPDEDGHQFPLSDTSEVDVLVLEPEESEEDEALSEESEEERQHGEKTVEEDKPKKGKNTGTIITIAIVIVLIIAVIIVFIWRNNKKTRKLY